MERPGHDRPRHLSDVIRAGAIAMVTTGGRLGHRSRPLTVASAVGDRLCFLVSEATDWVRDLQPGTDTECTVSDESDNHYVAVSGQSKVVHDPALIEELWSPGAEAFFDGTDDPDIRVLETTVTQGQWWEGPETKAGTLLAMVRSALAKDEDAMGDRGVVTPG
jgi:general stress protein 26